jgi:hypothetical protein
MQVMLAGQNFLDLPALYDQYAFRQAGGGQAALTGYF